MEITLVAFPQEGILACPGTMELLDEALRLGVETIGGLDPDVFDGDRTAHLDLVFSLAAKYDRSVDIHLHESGVGGLETMRGIAARTDSFGLSGRVCISHGFALATAPADQVATTIELLGETGVGLITSVPGEGLMPPIDRLLDGGVRVAVGSDNIRDSWSPFGRGDQLERSALAAYMVGWRSDAELERSFGLASAVPAELLGAAPAALRVGDPADFALIRAESVSEAIVSAPEDRIVYHLGHHVVGSPLKATLS